MNEVWVTVQILEKEPRSSQESGYISASRNSGSEEWVGWSKQPIQSCYLLILCISWGGYTKWGRTWSLSINASRVCGLKLCARKKLQRCSERALVRCQGLLGCVEPSHGFLPERIYPRSTKSLLRAEPKACQGFHFTAPPLLFSKPLVRTQPGIPRSVFRHCRDLWFSINNGIIGHFDVN